ncbi:hypothetical protein LTR86_004894 [Recurvomyces mirabilis]|nr:hypothetical protein LTR86_004894 [Recurvomyces mirabilis]
MDERAKPHNLPLECHRYQHHRCEQVIGIRMKIRRQGAVLALAATGAYAQGGYGGAAPSNSTTSLVPSSSPTATPSTSYTTVTYDDCPSMSPATLITITAGFTVTYCPECDMMSSSAAALPGRTTVYTTVFQSLCPTGLVPATYTVTESCSEATPTWTPGPSHVPQDFTVTTKACTVCGESTTAVTITEPCGCKAEHGTPIATPSGGSGSGSPAGNTPAETTPAGGSGSGGSSPAGSGSPAAAPSGGSSPAESGSSPAGSSPAGSGSSGSTPAGSGSSPAASSPVDSGSAPAGNAAPGSGTPGGAGRPANAPGAYPAPAAPGAGSNDSAPAAPLATTATQSCPGPACQTGGSPKGVAASPGAASSLSSFGLVAMTSMAVIVSALAFML